MYVQGVMAASRPLRDFQGHDVSMMNSVPGKLTQRMIDAFERRHRHPLHLEKDCQTSRVQPPIESRHRPLGEEHADNTESQVRYVRHQNANPSFTTTLKPSH